MVTAQKSTGEHGTLVRARRLPVRLLGSFRRSTSTASVPAVAAAQHQAAIDEYLGDMASSYGSAYRSTPATAPSRTVYNRLAHGLLAEARAQGERIDRIVLAHSLPDSQPGYSVCASLVHASDGPTTAFSVSDQRAATPFTALRIAAEYLHGDPDGRALVLALDQGELPWEVPGGTPVPDHEVGIGLLLGEGAPSGDMLHWRATGLDAADAARAVADVHTDVRRAFSGPVTFVLGGGVPPVHVHDPDTEIRRGPVGLVCTSVWTGLHDLRLTSPGRAVVVVEYDPPLGYFCAAATNLEDR
ncbi:hypothetical protein ABZ234_32755 [Nocardiopsis sp. NPDC006198]|uniref:hypothetical protein n=1 Tax=Nocardiopsis sp. NPDC006198 TaxID=3154472 RepID=UPI0033A824ED